MYSGIVDFLKLLGSLGLFLYGMKLMSESLQKVTGNKMRSILAAMTSNRIKGIFTGVLITAIIQSSSATTVMIVSFVNAGLLSLIESIGVIMGANIGTTITAWLISLLGFKVKMSLFAIPLIGIGFPFLFSKRTKLKTWGELIIGFAILFIGLGFLKDSGAIIKRSLGEYVITEHSINKFKENNIPDNVIIELTQIKDSVYPDVRDFEGKVKSVLGKQKNDYYSKIIINHSQSLDMVSKLPKSGYLSYIIFLFIGTLLTVVIQSSSATMALTIVLCAQGLIPFEMAAAMVLGENIGTTITANLASLVTNTSAKRSARAHLIFNVVGVLWMLAIFPYFIKFVDWFSVYTGQNSAFTDPKAIPIALAIFHTSFNISNVLIFAWFAPFIAKIVTTMIPDKDEDEEFRLKYIKFGLLSTSELSILQAKNEIISFAERATKMFGFLRKMLVEEKKKKFDKLFKKTHKYEEILDRMEVEIATYLTKVAEGELGKTGSRRVRAMYELIDDIESIGDSCYNMANTINRKVDQKIVFSEDLVSKLNKMFDLVEKSLNIMISNLKKEYNDVTIEEANVVEEEINSFRNQLREEHISNIKESVYEYKTGIIYSELFLSCEKLGDYTINVSESLSEAKEYS